MVRALKAIALFTLSGLVASAVGGVVGIFLLLTWSAGIQKVIPAIFLSAMAGPVAGIFYAALPAAFVGALLKLAASVDRRVDKALVWAGAGAVTGLGIFAYYDPSFGLLGPDAPAPPDRLAIACCLAAAGGVAALILRQTVGILSEFLPLSDEDDQTSLISRSRS